MKLRAWVCHILSRTGEGGVIRLDQIEPRDARAL
jgi:hypothetical protein